MYFVGIDISKFKHDCAVIDEIGDTIQPSWSFGNDREGFSLLKERLDSLPGEKKIGLEATGHYQSPERTASMNVRSYEPLRKISRGRFSLNDFVKLKALAKNTVGCTTDFFLQENVHPAGALHPAGRQGGGIG